MNPPHYNVYTRLKPSKIAGVGVFAIRDIPANTPVFNEEAPVGEEFIVNNKEIEKLDPEIQKLYNEFCVRYEDHISGPDNFDLVTVAWYVNHSRTPNVEYIDDNFISIRKIKKGEEITADYRTYSDESDQNWI